MVPHTKLQIFVELPLQRGSLPPRSLESFKADYYDMFISHGGRNLKNAKNFNNVIGETIFDIPLDNVSIENVNIISVPLSFNRLWTLLKEACSDLDFKLALHGHDSTSDPVVDNTLLKELSAMRVVLQTQQSYADVIKDMINIYTLKTKTEDAGQACGSLKTDLANTQQDIGRKVPNSHYIHLF